jgi:ORF6N domain
MANIGGMLGHVKQSMAEEPLEPLILTVRGRRVIRDVDLARLYEVRTKALNQAVKRNALRFPSDFAFQLTRADDAEVRASNESSAKNMAQNQSGGTHWSQFVTSSQKHRRAAFRPWVFTEHGSLMAANVLRSAHAVQMSIFVIRAFVRLREDIAANAAILRRLTEIDETLLQHDAALRDVYKKLQPLLAPPNEPQKRRIGF